MTLARPGGISYLHIPAPDPGRCAAFYEAVFGWTVAGKDTERPSFQDATGHVAGAWMSSLTPAGRAGLLPYIYVEGIDTVVAAIERHGGSIVRAPYDEGNLKVAEFSDPGGNVLGLWEMRTH